MEHNYTTGDKIKMKTKQETRKTRNKAAAQILANTTMQEKCNGMQ